MKKRDKIAISIFISFYISFGVLVTTYQEKIIYLPSQQDFETCNNFKDSEKTSYNGTRMYVKDISKPTVVFYHGNAGSACDRAVYADMFSQMGYGYIIVEYAGYSNDPKKPSHDLIKQDVRNVIEYVKINNILQVSVMGESIGTGIASYHAFLQPPDKLMLISPFTSLADIAKRRFWFYPTSFMVDNAFDNKILLAQYRNPVTIIHGNKDEIILYQLGQDLYSSLDTQKEFITVDGAGHNNLFDFAETGSVINNFLRK